jgi:uncharacterized protein YyaL (SSP411 family)
MSKQFNGQILFKINQSKLEKIIEEKQIEDKLDLMCKLINDHCKKYIAPNNDEKVITTWQWV